jgi:acylpyruvate hydrolase
MAAAAAAARPSFSAPILAIGRKIVAVGRNYAKHAQELNNAVPSSPILFLKPTSSYIAEGRAIEIPSAVRELQHEVELGVVIGKDVRDVPAKSAFDCVAGYVVALGARASLLRRASAAHTSPPQTRRHDRSLLAE